MMADRSRSQVSKSKEAMPMRISNRAASSHSLSWPKSEFPIKLYAMLQLAEDIPEFSQAVKWLPHGRAFRVIDKDIFMRQVVPVFFNQTKILSFNRQLYLWEFRRIGRGNEQVWYHKNFLRGMPESMEHMVRTKIKGNGNSIDRSNDGRVPKFDDLPALPTRDKEPSVVLDEMRRAILKIDRSSIVVTRGRDLTSPRSESESPCEHNVDLHPEEPFVVSPSLLPTSNYSQNTPYIRLHLPFQADTRETMMYTNQSSLEGMSKQVHSHAQMFPVRANAHANDEDFEPLPFWDDNDSCLGGDFANFIEGALQDVEG